MELPMISLINVVNKVDYKSQRAVVISPFQLLIFQVSIKMYVLLLWKFVVWQKKDLKLVQEVSLRNVNKNNHINCLCNDQM